MRLQLETLWFFSCLVYMPWFGLAKIDYCGRPGSKVRICKTNLLDSFHESSRKCTTLGNWGVLYETPGCQNNMDICQEELDIVRDIGRPVWINMYRKYSSDWLTVYGEPVNTKINGPDPYGNCAAIDTVLQNLAVTPCSRSGFPKGYVCAFKGKCPLYLRDKCFQLPNQKVLHVGYNVHIQNWYTARSVCRRFGGDLAIPSSTQEIKQIIKYIKPNGSNTMYMKTGKPVTSFFVGITKEYWTVPGLETGDTAKGEDHWAPGQPGEGDCVIITKEGRNTSSCVEKHATVCQMTGLGATEEVKRTIGYVTECTATHRVESPPDRHVAAYTIYDAVIVIMSALLVLVVLIPILLGIIIYNQRKKTGERNRKQEENRETTDNSVQVGISLDTTTEKGKPTGSPEQCSEEEETKVLLHKAQSDENLT